MVVTLIIMSTCRLAGEQPRLSFLLPVTLLLLQDYRHAHLSVYLSRLS